LDYGRLGGGGGGNDDDDMSVMDPLGLKDHVTDLTGLENQARKMRISPIANSVFKRGGDTSPQIPYDSLEGGGVDADGGSGITASDAPGMGTISASRLLTLAKTDEQKKSLLVGGARVGPAQAVSHCI